MIDQPNSAPSSPEVDALLGIRRFSLLSMIGFLILPIVLLVGLAHSNYNVGSLFFMTIFSLTIISSAILVIALLPLRSGYRTLKGISPSFDSAYTGTSLYFVGLILVIVGSLIAVFSVRTGLGTFIFGVIVIAVGGIAAFVGTVLALIIGTFRLNDRYDGFAAPAVLFILGIFLPFCSLIAVILTYTRTDSAISTLLGGK